MRRSHGSTTAAGALLVLTACSTPETEPPDNAVDSPAVPSPTAAPPPAPIPSPTAPDTEPDAAGVTPEQRRAADLPVARTEVTGTVWDGKVVAVGGLDQGGGAVARADLYDPDTDTWSSGPDLPVALHHTAVVPLGDRVYVVGGYTIEGGSWVPQDAVWSLGPGDDGWREEPPLGTPRGALAVASTGHRLVAIGGVDPSQQVLASTEVFDPDAGSWTAGPDLATPREHLDATAVGDEVFAIAGRAGGFGTNRDSVEVLRDGAWHAAPEVQHSRGGIGAATVEGRPCVAGGEEPGGTIAPVECLIDDAWQVVGELEVARHGLVVAAVDGNLHVIGGGPEPGLTVSDVHEVLPVAAP